MRIFEENGKIRLQLMDLQTKQMLFDFIIEDDIIVLKTLGDHIEERIKAYIKERGF